MPAKGSKLTKHDWIDYERRFVVIREWINLEQMHHGLAAQLKGTGKNAPSHTLIRKRAAEHKWMERRQALEQQATAEAITIVQSERRTRLVTMYAQLEEDGSGLLNLGKEYIDRLEKARAAALKKGDKNAPGAVTSTYEALAMMRIGAMLKRLGAEALAGGRTQTGDKSTDPEAEAIDELPQGIVIIPAQQTEDQWLSQRRKNLEAPKDKDDKKS